MLKQIYQDSYNMCVTKLKYSNKISVSMAGYEVCALILNLQFMLLIQFCFRK